MALGGYRLHTNHQLRKVSSNAVYARAPGYVVVRSPAEVRVDLLFHVAMGTYSYARTM